MGSEWEPPLGDLEDRQRTARAMGGEEKLARQRAGGRLDARARVERLCDPGTFRELGTLVASVPRRGGAPVPADALVAGTGLIDGRPVVVAAEDFTVLGGSIGIGTHGKRHRAAELARQERIPLVMLLDGAGERAQNSFERYPHAPIDLQALAQASGLVPMVAVVMGPSAGHGALTAPLMDFVVMVEGSALFSAGPPLVEDAIGEKVTKEDLGGVGVHVVASGVAHNVAADDGAALDLVRRYLSYLPANAWSRPPVTADGPDTGERRLDAILDLIPPDPRKGYDVRPVVDLLCDEGSVLEIQPSHGASIVTALSRLGGRSVAVVANQPAVRAGSVDTAAALKAAHFIDVVGAFHLPVVFLADNPGVLAGSAAERAGILRASARMYLAQAKLESPKLHVTLRKAYGFGSSVMAMNDFDRQTVRYAFPGARLGAMPARGAGRATRAEESTQELLAAAEVGGAYSTADTLGYDEVIDPRELRNAFLHALRLADVRTASTAPQPVRPTGIRP